MALPPLHPHDSGEAVSDAAFLVALDEDADVWLHERWYSGDGGEGDDDQGEGAALLSGGTALTSSSSPSPSSSGVAGGRAEAASPHRRGDKSSSALAPAYSLVAWFWNAGLLCCVVSALFFSCNAVLVKLLHAVPVFQIALARSSLSLVFTYSLMSANKTYGLYTTVGNLPWLVLRGTVGSSAMLLFYVGLQITPLADAQSIFFMYPALTAVMSFLFLGERLRILQMMGVIASIAGVVLIAHPPMLFGGHSDWGAGRGIAMGFLVGSAFAAASAITVIRKLSARESSIIMALWFHLTALAVSIPALAVGWPKPPVMDLGPTGWICLGGVACTSFVAQLLFNRGIQLMTGATAACIASLQVPLAHMWGALLFHEVPTVFSVGGTALVIAGLVAVNRGNQEQSTATEEGGVATVTPAVAAIHLIKSRSHALLQRATSLGRATSIHKAPVTLTSGSSDASDLIECEEDATNPQAELELVSSP